MHILQAMLLKLIQQKFKQKSALNYLEAESKKPRALVGGEVDFRVACIVDFDKVIDLTIFDSLAEELRLKSNSMYLIGYKRKANQQNQYSIPYCTDNDIGWKGSINNPDFYEFQQRKYSILINYYVEDSLLLKLMSAKTRARIRVGFKQANNHFDNLIFDCGLQEFDTFKRELVKYLKILKELN